MRDSLPVRSQARANGRYRMPAEWEPHEACLMAWPTRGDLWGPYYERAKDEYAAVAKSAVNAITFK
jgi:agmatine/peptidylarginine deiminase